MDLTEHEFVNIAGLKDSGSRQKSMNTRLIFN